MEKTFTLSVDRNSWHYAYYVKLNRLWGRFIYPHSMKQTSICPYVQYMFWFTLLAVALSPIALLGFIYLFVGRIVYNFISPARVLERIFDCDLSNWRDYPRIADSEYFGLVMQALWLTLSLFVITAITTLAGTAVYNFHLIGYYFFVVIHYIWKFFIHIGYASFYIYALLYATAGMVYSGLIKFWSNTSFFTIFYWAAMVIGVIFIAGLVLAILQEVFFLLERASAKRRVNRQITIEEQPSSVQSEPTFLDKLLRKIKDAIHNFFFSREEIIDGKPHKILSPFAIFWNFVLAIKHQVCPIIVFVDSKTTAPEKQSDDN
jgi:hypothetical protein